MRLRLCFIPLPVLALSCSLLGCSDPPLDGYTAPDDVWVSSDRTRLRDSTGRVVIFRGVNARVDGIFDVTFDDGRVPLETVPSFDTTDAVRMRELGLNLLRLPINWSGIEPTEGSYDEDYLDRVAAVVEMCAMNEVHVIIDFHQDAYSKEIGEDGAPLWAIHPPPDMLLEGPLGDSLADRITSAQVQRAYTGFFVDDDEDREDERLQSAFAAMARHVAERFADEDHVLGYDLYNEPIIDDRYLLPFHERVTAAIREVDSRHLVLFEPSATRNFTERAPLSRVAFPDDGGVYAVHLYTFAFTDSNDRLEALTRADLEPNVANAVEEAARWNVPLLVGEWGIGPTAPNMDLFVSTMLDLFDENGASSAVWLWKEESQGRWGFFEQASEDSWVERPEVIAAHARIYPERIAGDPVRIGYDRGAQRFELTTEGRGDLAPHVLHIPESYPESFRVSCDGRELETPRRDAATGRVEVVCAGRNTHTLVIEP